MNDKDQIKALAELDGIEPWRPVLPFESEPVGKRYLTSYDAIIPLARQHVGAITFNETPAQLAERVLRATGRWIE